MGIEFAFKPSPTSRLRLLAIQNLRNIDIKYSFKLQEGLDPSVGSLVSMVSNNLVDSFIMEIGSMVANAQAAADEDRMRKAEIRAHLPPDIPQDVEIIEVNSEDDIDFEAIRRNMQARKEVTERLAKEDFVQSLWKETAEESSSPPSSSSSESTSYHTSVTIPAVSRQEQTVEYKNQVLRFDDEDVSVITDSSEPSLYVSRTDVPDSSTTSLRQESSDRHIGTTVGDTSTAAQGADVQEMDSEEGNLLFKWDQLPHEENTPYRTEVVITFLQQWAKGMAKKGIGIDAENVDHGVQLSFVGTSDVKLLIMAKASSAGDMVRVFSREEITIGNESVHMVSRWQGPMRNLLDELLGELRKLDVAAVDGFAVAAVAPTASLPYSRPSSHSGSDNNPLHNQADSQRETTILVDEQTSARADAQMINISSSSSRSDGSSTFTASDNNSMKNQDYELHLDSIDEVERAFQLAKETLGHIEEPSSSSSSSRSHLESANGGGVRRHAVTATRAQEAGVNLDKFEGDSVQSEAVRQLKRIMQRSREQGFYSVLEKYHNEDAEEEDREEEEAKVHDDDEHSVKDQRKKQQKRKEKEEKVDLDDLFRMGREISQLNLEAILDRPSNDPFFETAEDLKQPPAQFPVILDDKKLQADLLSGEKIDIFQGPQGYYQEKNTINPRNLLSGDRSGTAQDQDAAISKLQEHFRIVDQAAWDLDAQRLEFLVTEMQRAPVEMQALVLDGFRDLLLSDNILPLLQQANQQESSTEVRQLYSLIVDKSVQLHTELAALMQQETVRHLETISQICEVARSFQADDLQFLERMDALKPKFDTQLLGYLSYAIKEEETRLRKKQAELNLPVFEASRWLKVLTILHQGVLAEFETRYAPLLEMVLLIIRFHDTSIRRAIFERFVAITAPTDLGFLRQLALNMVERILSGNDPEILRILPHQHPRMLQVVGFFRQEIDDLLSEDIIAERVAAYSDYLEKTTGQVMELRHRNPAIQDELEMLERLVHETAMRGVSKTTSGSSKKVETGILGPPSGAGML